MTSDYKPGPRQAQTPHRHLEIADQLNRKLGPNWRERRVLAISISAPLAAEIMAALENPPTRKD